ncbi:30S ribosomal protein S9 [Patescibacteria group bacterium]
MTKTKEPKKEKKKDKEEKIEKTEEKLEKNDSVEKSYYEAVGRRREATARVRLYVVADERVTIGQMPVNKGQIVVNGRKVEDYFPGEPFKKRYLEPFRTTNTIGRFAVSIKISGGGLNGQLGAVIHGIARALEKVDKDKYRPILKKRGFLTRDPRAKQRIKAGYAHKARAKKQSPKR